MSCIIDVISRRIESRIAQISKLMLQFYEKSTPTN